MAKIYPIIKRISNEEAVDLAASVGTEDESLAPDGTLRFTPAIGNEDESGPVVEVIEGTLPAGTENEELTPADATGSEHRSAGSENEATTLKSGTAEALPTSTQNAAMVGESSAVASGESTTTTQLGTDWQNRGNMNVGFNPGPLATISASAGVGTPDTYDDTMTSSAFQIGATPPGWTRTKIEVLVRHDWDIEVGLLSSLRHVIEVTMGGNTTRIFDKTQNTGNRVGLVEDAFDVTATYNGMTDAQIQGAFVTFDAIADILAGGGNCNWNVDYAKIRITYTRASIP